MAFTKIPKDTLAYWGIRILLVLIPAAAAAIGAIRVAGIEANTAKTQAEAGYVTAVERIKALEEHSDEQDLKIAKLEGEVEALLKTSPVKMEAPAPARRPTRSPMPKNLEGAFELQMKK